MPVIDIHIEVPRVDYEKLSSDRMGETSESIRKGMQAARNIQQQHFASSQSDIICNAEMRVGEMRQFCKLQDEGVALSLSKCQSLMRAAITQLNLSARAYHRTRSVKLAWTIKDLANDLHASHPSEVERRNSARLWRRIIDLCLRQCWQPSCIFHRLGPRLSPALG